VAVAGPDSAAVPEQVKAVARVPPEGAEGVDSMKLSIPSMGDKGLEEQVGEHFGRVPNYTLFDTDTNEVEVIENTSEHMGGRGYPPDLLAQHGVNVMICGGLGRRAISMFEEYGIVVFVGASGKVKDAIKLWQSGQLQRATDENACAQHAFRGEGIGGGHGHKH
jgi:predicted Fe-Mo cluster-binding NifX family protein